MNIRLKGIDEQTYIAADTWAYTWIDAHGEIAAYRANFRFDLRNRDSEFRSIRGILFVGFAITRTSVGDELER